MREVLRVRIALTAAVLITGCSPAASEPAPASVRPPTPGSAASPSPVAERVNDPGAQALPSVEPAIPVDPIAASWTRELDAIATGPRVSVAVGVDDRIVYVHGGAAARVPASAEKLLTSFAALEVFGPTHRFPTVAAAAARPRDGVVHGDLWLVGGGDPELGAARLGTLADALVRSGIRRVSGSVVGDTSAFSRRWWAPGWVHGISRDYVTRPTALAYEGNVGPAPELAAAGALTDALLARGVTVDAEPRSGAAPDGLRELARVRSAPLHDLLTRQNHDSLNLHAEILLRAIGATEGAPTTAGGADVVDLLASDEGLELRVRDGSGLSHANAVSAVELTSMLLVAASEPWAPAFEASLPTPGQGTLSGRLIGAPVQAKTGTLFTVPCSALVGYARDANGRRVAFAVLSDGISKGSSLAIEDAVARVLVSSAIA
jgi:D-alanyl-D-alanine carboxypeptidase/D-alanyl-D-alanine-endopeptidase (penicillin-binding protein 4)